ncbi:MAG: DEAD/DEAH box helicase [Candidatus Caenarcaniphilales bacterium]|nr:DEAD/DEAH box helicase [Candidatus Caenarcaniphilales bacterium]
MLLLYLVTQIPLNTKKHRWKLASFTCSFGSLKEQKAGYLILDLLANYPAKDLAQKRYGEHEFDKYLPIRFITEKINRESLFTIHINSEDEFHGNKFQKSFWDKVHSTDSAISISAPTSVGKSFIAKKWIKYLLDLETNVEVNIAVLVPSRALINEFEADFKEMFHGETQKILISSSPHKSVFDQLYSKKIYIFTQERMNLFLSINKNTGFKGLFVDEAYKIADGSRGMLLEAVIDKLYNDNPDLKLVFASPHIENPEDIFYDCLPLKETTPLVCQNRFYLHENTEDDCFWDIERVTIQNEKIYIGRIQSPSNKKIKSNKAKLANFAHSLGSQSSGNIIFANDGYQAENIAEEISKLMPEVDDENDLDSDILDLIELCKDVVHPNFRLINFLKKNIGFHYGSLPQLIRVEIEKLFKAKKIKFLVCTSTLLEGVNLGCTNIFINNPGKGNQKKISSGDLLNLEGRAGRLGQEFQGNIFYIDWDNSSNEKKELTIKRATSNLIEAKFNEIIDLLETKKNIKSSNLDTEAIAGLVFNQFSPHSNLDNSKIIQSSLPANKIEKLNDVLREYKKKLSIPEILFAKYPITYHYSMQELYEYFKEEYSERPEDLLIEIKPIKKNANGKKENPTFVSINRALIRVGKFFKTSYGQNPKYHSLLSSNWITGYSLPFMVASTLTWNKNFNKDNSEFIALGEKKKKPKYSNSSRLQRY